MNETRDISLGGRVFSVPRLPLRANMAVYPLCRKLTNAGLVERMVAAGGALDCTAEEMADLSEIAWRCAELADPDLARSDFDDLPVSPPELADAFFAARYQSGAWKPVKPSEGRDPKGEGKGAKTPRKSTSVAS